MKTTKLLGAGGLLIAILAIVFYDSLIRIFVDFMGSLSGDNNLLPVTITRLRGLIEFGLMVLLGGSLLLVTGLFRRMIDQIELELLRKFFLTDPLSSKQYLLVPYTIVSIFSGLVLHLHFLLLGPPSHEGIIEQASVVLFLLSGVILLSAAAKADKVNISAISRTSVRVALLAVAGFLIWVAGEEISWGQRIFNWESVGVFAEYNVQKETNLHNFFNRSFRYIYPTVGMGTFLIILLLLNFSKYRQEYLFQLLMPHSALLIPLFFLACSSFIGENETFEALFSVIVLLYSFRIFYCVSFPASRYANTEGG